MTFAWPWMLTLAVVPGLLIVTELLARQRRTPAATATEAGGQIRRGSIVGGRIRFDAAARLQANLHWRFWLSFLLVVVALARPQWGAPDVATDTAGSEVVIALDLSRSMLAQDVLPTRLEHARLLAGELVDALPEQRTGLIGFAGAAHLLAPPSEDQSLLRSFLASVKPEHVLQQGTNLASLLDTATTGFGSVGPNRLLLILSDGEAATAAWRTRLPTLRQQGIRVVAVGIGTKAGSLLWSADGRPLRDRDGDQVRSRLDARSLAAIADSSGGVYLASPSTRELVEQVQAASRTAATMNGTGSGKTRAGAEKFTWFLAAALLVMVWSAAREWPAMPCRSKLFARRFTSGSLIAACLVASGLQQASMAARPVVPDLRGQEPDPLTRIKAVVGRLLAKNKVHAADYRELAEASIRYGEVHRGHGHPLSSGVLRDGLSAIEQGRKLDPTAADWHSMNAKLRHLLKPPPPVPQADPGPADPANEHVDAKQQVPIVADEPAGNKRKPSEAESREAGERQGMRDIGGSRRDVYDPAEWRNPSLVQPLYRLEQIRSAASPVGLFRLRQAPAAGRRNETGQTW